ncbi:uncharacterized protein LOC121177009 isoform X2 [Toxotes jaculatrix]|uniref:uncharacterized protein LOC121177009 isoform X2 n=1 Tax=Toxotes jaculatrix TaxID=941984 RepID=UPI001B3B0804|nr:uncharacterized protein LOC121177009 isoform X2 [Toxotes jaculatrix]
MRNFAVVTVLLLCNLSWISDSVSEFYIVEVQPGKEVTLLCTNYTSSPTLIIWFRVLQRLEPRCIFSMFKASEAASFCDGFQNGKFEVTSNISTIFLKINQVDLSDSGLYFCGYHINKNPVMVGATYLEVQELFPGFAKVMSGILGGLTVFLVMVIIGLVVKIRHLQTAQTEEKNPQQTEGQGSDDLNYAAVSFRPRRKRSLRPASEREEELKAIYSATR